MSKNFAHNFFFIKDIRMTKRQMKRSSTSLVIREIETKTTERYPFTLTRQVITKKDSDEDMEKLEPSYLAGGNVKWCSYF